MALFRGTIENQIGTLNQVNEQIARQKAMEQEIAMKKYLLGKEFDDDRLTGQATGTMLNTGLIPGMFSGIKDLVRGYERHNPSVDAELSADLFPKGEGLTEEQRQHNERIKRLRSMSNTDRVKQAAFKTYKEVYGEDISEQNMEELFKKDYYYSNGVMKKRKDLNDSIRDVYDKNERQLKQDSIDARKAEIFEDEDAELRQHVKKRGIDKLKKFTGSHSNMRNQNMKYHKDLIDFYVKRKNWDKAQKVQDAYVLNEKNIDKYWGDKGRKNYDSLFQRPSRGGTSKKLVYHGIRGIGEGGEDIAIPMDKNRIDDVGYVKAMIARHSGKAAADRYQAMIDSGRGVSTYDASDKDTNIPSWKKQALKESNADSIYKTADEDNFFQSDKDRAANITALSRTDIPYLWFDGVKVTKELAFNDPYYRAELLKQYNKGRKKDQQISASQLAQIAGF